MILRMNMPTCLVSLSTVLCDDVLSGETCFVSLWTVLQPFCDDVFVTMLCDVL